MARKIISVAVASGLIFGVSFAASHDVDAAKAKTYANCKALNKDYKGGVARSKSAKNKGGKTHYKPYVSKALYDKNKTKDRGHDNIACER
ncbi:excalibur calcium-binding domain-containing protein [Weizmannia sp. FSL K6-3076]|uniref:excalibur calcium-binding domain-containing protein n=1 Tax=Weizmannia sp. FSL K6-3076 TaxID=2954542 RepID=UPI0030F72DEB